jgi:hypothetical protein
MGGHGAESDVGWRDRVWLRWWAFKCWFYRCPECGHRPDRHYGLGPRWEDDKIARMLGVGQYGCRRCGAGAVKERDTRVTPPGAPDA